MYTTQTHLSISDISNDILLLKQGGGALVLQVSAVNFGLLSDREQMAIISSFAQMLNSLSFSIQIVIRSTRLNIVSYLALLDHAQKVQTNPLLAKMIVEYKQFIQSTVKENEVLDKQFFIVVPLFSLELGLTASKASLEQKIKTILLPRRDQVIRQLNRVGLKATQVNKQKLIELFYGIYNGEEPEKPAQLVNPQDLVVKLNNPNPLNKPGAQAAPSQPTAASAPGQKPPQPVPPPVAAAPAPGQPVNEPAVTRNAKTHPFVVEELSE